eukprot:jgi/Mesen1/2851/ME000174S02105
MTVPGVVLRRDRCSCCWGPSREGSHAHLRTSPRHTHVYVGSVQGRGKAGELGVIPARGLASEEAAARLKEYGPNVASMAAMPRFLAFFAKEIYEPTQRLCPSYDVVRGQQALDAARRRAGAEAAGAGGQPVAGKGGGARAADCALFGSFHTLTLQRGPKAQGVPQVPISSSSSCPVALLWRSVKWRHKAWRSMLLPIPASSSSHRSSSSRAEVAGMWVLWGGMGKEAVLGVQGYLVKGQIVQRAAVAAAQLAKVVAQESALVAISPATRRADGGLADTLS